MFREIFGCKSRKCRDRRIRTISDLEPKQKAISRKSKNTVRFLLVGPNEILSKLYELKLQKNNIFVIQLGGEYNRLTADGRSVDLFINPINEKKKMKEVIVSQPPGMESIWRFNEETDRNLFIYPKEPRREILSALREIKGVLEYLTEDNPRNINENLLNLDEDSESLGGEENSFGAWIARVLHGEGLWDSAISRDLLVVLAFVYFILKHNEAGRAERVLGVDTFRLMLTNSNFSSREKQVLRKLRNKNLLDILSRIR